jgi:hypothetical protein
MQDNNRTIIIVIVLFLLLCCCCTFLSLGWFYGDALLEMLEAL